MKFYLNNIQQNCIDNIKKTLCDVIDTIRIHEKEPIPYKYNAIAFIPKTISLYFADGKPDCVKFCDINLREFSIIKTEEYNIEYNIDVEDYDQQKLLNFMHENRYVVINVNHINDGMTDAWVVKIQSTNIYKSYFSTKNDLTNYDIW